MKRHSLSLIEVEKQFGTEAQCANYLASVRWPNGPRCLKCGSDKISFFQTNETEREVKDKKGEPVLDANGEPKMRRVPARCLFQCNAAGCRHQFSPITGTIFTDTHLPLSTWFKAIAILANAKKSIASLQLSRDLGVHERTAWHLSHRIREAMQSEQGLFGGVVEIDATFHGGRFDKRRKRAAYDKQPVAGVIQRTADGAHSKVKAYPVEKEIAKVMTGVLDTHVAKDAAVMSDDAGAYRGLTAKGWKHEIVAHGKEEWTRGQVHTQGIDGFWSLFKRQIVGQHHSVSVKHLKRYLNECSFKFNNRQAENLFGMIVLNLVIGSALRYKALTAETEEKIF